MKYQKYYLSYTGAQLPLKMVNALEEAEIQNRNTYFGVCVDEKDQTTLIHKVVYGEIELEHRYGYDDSGKLAWAEILDDEGEIQTLHFNGSK